MRVVDTRGPGHWFTVTVVTTITPAMAQAYRGTRITQAAAHCDRLVTLSRDSAKEATAAAEMHKQLAGVAR
jgi:hypothetical protein